MSTTTLVVEKISDEGDRLNMGIRDDAASNPQIRKRTTLEPA